MFFDCDQAHGYALRTVTTRELAEHELGQFAFKPYQLRSAIWNAASLFRASYGGLE
jgi:hypothetical protein